MTLDAHLHHILAREKIESWLREAERDRAAKIAVAHRGASHLSDAGPRPHTWARVLAWARTGARFASNLRLW